MKPSTKTLTITILYALATAALLFAGRYGLLIPVFLAALILTPGAPVYVIITLINTIRNRRKEDIQLQQAEYDSERETYLQNQPAYTFNTTAQQHTLALNILTTITGISFIILLISMIQTHAATGNTTEPQDILLWSIGPVFILQSILMLIINIPLIYDNTLRLAEQHAINTRTGAWKTIRTNRIWAWTIWTTGGLIGLSILGYWAYGLFIL